MHKGRRKVKSVRSSNGGVWRSKWSRIQGPGLYVNSLMNSGMYSSKYIMVSFTSGKPGFGEATFRLSFGHLEFGVL